MYGAYSHQTATIKAHESVEAAATRHPGAPIRVRVQPQLFMPPPPHRRYGMYLSWKGVFWNFQCQDVEEVLALHRAMMSFFWQVREHGSPLVNDWLDRMPHVPLQSASRTMTTTMDAQTPTHADAHSTA